MKRYIKLFSAIIAVVIFAVSCSEQNLSMIFGSNLDSKISATISGTHREYDSRYFSSDSGTYQRNDHPQITIHDDSTFSVKLDRTLYNSEGEYVRLCFDLNRVAGELEIGKLYPLYMKDDSRAYVELVDRKDDSFETSIYNTVEDGYSLQIRRYTLVASSSQESLVLEVLPRQGIRSLWREAYLPIAASVGVMTMAVQHTNN